MLEEKEKELQETKDTHADVESELRQTKAELENLRAQTSPDSPSSRSLRKVHFDEEEPHTDDHADLPKETDIDLANEEHAVKPEAEHHAMAEELPVESEHPATEEDHSVQTEDEPESTPSTHVPVEHMPDTEEEISATEKDHAPESEIKHVPDTEGHAQEHTHNTEEHTPLEHEYDGDETPMLEAESEHAPTPIAHHDASADEYSPIEEYAPFDKVPFEHDPDQQPHPEEQHNSSRPGPIEDYDQFEHAHTNSSDEYHAVKPELEHTTGPEGGE
jgi:hypothetical protein